MSDYSDRYTDKKISEVDRALKRTYRTAQTELKKKLADFNKRFNEKSREKKQQVKDGKITEQEYKDWLTGQVFIRNQWQSQINAVNSVLLDHNKQAIKIINNGTLDVFAESYNFNAFRAESMIAASFTLYNAESVARLILGDPQLLPEWKINEKKDYVWNYDKVNNIVRQAIIQGKGIEEITGELCSRLSTTNESKMRMFARTALGSAQNAGRQKQMEDAAALGIEVNKQWEAAHDSKTRDSHRALDGEEVPYDEEFSNGLMFPKDPTGAPEEVYNCRCTMKTVYPKYEDRTKPDWREEEVIDGESYREWKKFDNYAEWKKWKEETGQVKTNNNPDNYTTNSQIVEQLEKDGFVLAGLGSTLEGIDIKCSRMIYDCYKRTFERFPFLESWDFENITARSLEEGVYADCDPENGRIRVALAAFKDMGILKAYYDKDVKEGYHPKGTNVEAVIFHEIGHRIDAILQNENGFADRYSKTMFEQCLNKGGTRPWRTFEKHEAYSQIGLYAGKDEEEWFAECFATYMTAKEEDMSEMQKAWNSLFESAIRRLS